MNDKKEFLRRAKEWDQLKSVLRQTKNISVDRRENSAEHSWHLATLVLLYDQYFNEEFDVFKAMKMAILHDIVEYQCGDVFLYDEEGRKKKALEEAEASRNILGTLPRADLLEIWEEFESKSSKEAKIVAGLDRLQPILCNRWTQGHSWKNHGITEEKVLSQIESWKKNCPTIAEMAVGLIKESAELGYFAPANE